MRKVLLGDGHQSQVLPERALWNHISTKERAEIKDVLLKLPKNAGNLSLRQRPFADRSKSVQVAYRDRKQAADATEYSDRPTSKPALDHGHHSQTTFYVESSASAADASPPKKVIKTERKLAGQASSRTNKQSTEKKTRNF